MSAEPLLAIDTSSALCTVVLAVDGRCAVSETLAQRSHKELLLPMIARLAEHTGVALRDLALLGCVIGPGSFTGVRIGVAATQALALAAGAGVVRLHALQLLALAHRRALREPPTGTLVSWRHSRAELYYASALEHAATATPLIAVANAPASDPRTALLATPLEYERWRAPHGEPLVHLGEVPPWLATTRTADPVGTTSADSGQQHGETLVRAVHAGREAGLAEPPGAALPLYLEADSPWQPA